MKRFIENHWPWIVIFFLSFLVTWPIFVNGYFSHHDDLQVMRIFEMRKCFSDLQIPCRWVPDMGYGNGYPLFNFYGVLPYYIGGAFSYVLGYIGSAKFLFFLPLLFGGVGMYFLAKELFGKFPGFIGGVLYLFAPYRALDAYVRGAIGESFAIALVPFVFYFIKKRNFVWTVVFTAAFLMSHNIMTLIFTPLIIFWAGFWLIKEKGKGLKVTLLSLGIAFGLSAFFILPAFFEKGLIQTQGLTQGELNFRAQFVKVSQLFVDKKWSYGASDPMSVDTISYQIGWPHWWLVIFTLFPLFFLKKRRKDIPLIGFLVLIFAFGVFMTHNKSAPIWESINILTFVQFPWRFLAFAIFASSLIGAYFVSLFKDRWLVIVGVLVVTTAILFNWRYFRPKEFYYGLTDNQKLSGQSFIDQQKGALLDYLPLTATEPLELAPKDPYLVSGEAAISNYNNKSNIWSFDVDVKKEAVVEVPVFSFPGWSVNYPASVGTIGRIAVKLPAGKTNIIGRFENTPIRTLANTITILSFLAFIIIYAKDRKILI